MRVALPLALFVFALLACPAPAQPKKNQEKPAKSSRAILANLQHEVRAEPFREILKLSQFLQLTHEMLQSADKEVRFNVDEEAFREEPVGVADILDHEIRLRVIPGKVSVVELLRQALKQMPVRSAFVVRGGKVEIVPLARTSKEFMFNQTFHVDFKEQKLQEALDELSELTGVSIVLDARARQKAQTLVTARFHDDVALQDAVRMLADMAELKIVYLATGMYVTTAEHAPVMQKELWKSYGVPDPSTTPAPGAGPGPLTDPMQAPAPIDYPPLFPPLPPSRGKRLDAAA